MPADCPLASLPPGRRASRGAPRAAPGRGAGSLYLRSLFVVVLTLGSGPARAQPEAPPPPPVLRLSLAEAVEAGLARSYTMRLATADRDVSEAQIREAWSSLYPKLDALVTYQRTFLTPNPFAGSDAADLFTGINTGDWLSFNERVRRGGDGLDTGAVGSACPAAVDGQGNLQVIGFDAYASCIGAAREAVRLGPAASPDDNPFLVENTFRAGLSASQLLYSGSAFAAVRAAKTASDLSAARLERTGQTVAGEVVAAYYAVLLARESVEVVRKSVERTRKTVEETASRVKEGVVPQFQLLSVEVELANLETELVTTRDRAATAEDNLSFVIGVPVGVELVLTDPLALPEGSVTGLMTVDEAMAVAAGERPDLAAAKLDVELNEVAEEVTFARYLPELRLVADLTAVGNVPDDRSRIFSTPTQDPTLLLPANPFGFESEDRGIFDDAFWGTNFTAGLNLTWNLFEGFATAAKQRQDELATLKARIRREQLEESVRLQVAQERRNVASALERVDVQRKNVDRAELNYRHAQLRVKEGVSSQLELREASQQLDQSRFNRLQAVHDYLVARSSFEVAIGRPPFAEREETSP